MLKRKLAITLLFFSLPVFAAQNATQDLIHLLNDFEKAQGSFVQTVYAKHKADQEDKILQQSEGAFALSRPGKFRWQTVKPSAQLLIADGKKIWMYDEALQQVNVKKQPKQQMNTPAFLLSGDLTQLSKDYVITESKSDANTIIFKLKPKRESFFNEVDIRFNKNILAGMQIWDNLGQNTDIEFKSVTASQSVNDKLFKFTPPAGVDVVQG